MTLRKKMALPLAAACMVLGLMVVAQSASALHPRPLGASPYRAALVVAYQQCGVDKAPNSTHKPPLAVPSCAGDTTGNPAGVGPAQISTQLTTGNQSATWGAANMTGDVTLVATGTDVSIKSTITDVRCRPGAPVTGSGKCGAPNGVDGAGGANCTGAGCVPGTSGTLTPPDYGNGGEIQGTTEIQITDHGNTGPAFTTQGTMVRIPFPVTGTCAFTSSTSVGGTCTVNTTANAVCGCVFPGDRGNVEFTQPLVINDGGADGVVSTADNTMYLRNGIFIP